MKLDGRQGRMIFAGCVRPYLLFSPQWRKSLLAGFGFADERPQTRIHATRRE
jgi:hypothetical protein